MDIPHIPAVVMALAEQVQMAPIAWRLQGRTVVIVFEQGPKLTFDRVPLRPRRKTAAAGAAPPAPGGAA